MASATSPSKRPSEPVTTCVATGLRSTIASLELADVATTRAGLARDVVEATVDAAAVLEGISEAAVALGTKRSVKAHAKEAKACLRRAEQEPHVLSLLEACGYARSETDLDALKNCMQLAKDFAEMNNEAAHGALASASPSLFNALFSLKKGFEGVEELRTEVRERVRKLRRQYNLLRNDVQSALGCGEDLPQEKNPEARRLRMRNSDRLYAMLAIVEAKIGAKFSCLKNMSDWRPRVRGVARLFAQRLWAQALRRCRPLFPQLRAGEADIMLAEILAARACKLAGMNAFLQFLDREVAGPVSRIRVLLDSTIVRFHTVAC
eukprot:tig00020801_g13940.t1